MSDRVIRAGILTSDAVNSLSWAGEVFYRRLMSVVDDFGRYDGRISILRAVLYPLKLNTVSEPDVAKWMDECSKAALVRGYDVDGKQYVEILKFDQRLRAKRSRWPTSDSKCQQMTTSADAFVSVSVSESNSDSNSGSRSPPNGKHGFVEFEKYRMRVYRMVNRPETEPMGYVEMSVLAELIRSRPNFSNEIGLLEEFKAKSGGFFPQSVSSLVEKWQHTLDRSRNVTHKEAPTYVQIKNLEEAIDRHPANSESTYHKQNCTDLEKADLRAKRIKLRELKATK